LLPAPSCLRGRVGRGKALQELIEKTENLSGNSGELCPVFAEAPIAFAAALKLSSFGNADVEIAPFALFVDHEHSGGVQLPLEAFAVWLAAAGSMRLEEAADQGSALLEQAVEQGSEGSLELTQALAEARGSFWLRHLITSIA
jgi:hypothetical protein